MKNFCKYIQYIKFFSVIFFMLNYICTFQQIAISFISLSPDLLLFDHKNCHDNEN